ncbi:TetR/AcrR family transcriptional regulator [Sphingomonas sp. NFR15]|uniref:TetR/AcrR family transcriptional regulator n=1 Tax=Sphingomonas sp. NFR15 TaxID=1566282 RepID=UPI00088C0736|nr:TetR/AcrR family transcriptional regulator [Sphingomonas sp. NFR15]SDA25917.1 transcriptional regulator, TetR family [Sphingomonas sp. NFR15]
MSVAACPFPSRAQARREKIKQVARRLFIEHGFHATGIALIAKLSGVAVQQLYRDFPSKEDIIAAIVAEDCDRFANLATLDCALATDDRDALRQWLESATCQKDDETDRLFLEIAAEASRNARIHTIFSDVRRTMLDNISRAFAGLAGSDRVGEEHRLLAEAFMIVSVGAAATRAVHTADTRSAGAKLISCLLDGIHGGPDQSPAATPREGALKPEAAIS